MTAAVWTDPEFWGPVNPYNPGCWMCIEHPPVVRLDNSRLCAHCLARWFPGRSVDWALSWLERQVQEAIRQADRRKRKKVRQPPLPLEYPEPVLV